MSRLFYGIMVAFCLSIFPLTIGCGSGGPEIIEQSSDVDIAAEDAAYEKQMVENDKPDGE